jgi:hypothetical protein
MEVSTNDVGAPFLAFSAKSGDRKVKKCCSPQSFAYFAKEPALSLSKGAQKRRLPSRYNLPRKVLTTVRIAFSLRRYQRHCPFLVASTSPALVRIAM